jgi:hypothetical protein
MWERVVRHGKGLPKLLDSLGIFRKRNESEEGYDGRRAEGGGSGNLVRNQNDDQTRAASDSRELRKHSAGQPRAKREGNEEHPFPCFSPSRAILLVQKLKRTDVNSSKIDTD